MENANTSAHKDNCLQRPPHLLCWSTNHSDPVNGLLCIGAFDKDSLSNISFFNWFIYCKGTFAELMTDCRCEVISWATLGAAGEEFPMWRHESEQHSVHCWHTWWVCQVGEVCSGGDWDSVQGRLGHGGLRPPRRTLSGHQHHGGVGLRRVVGRHHARLHVGLNGEGYRESEWTSVNFQIQLSKAKSPHWPLGGAVTSTSDLQHHMSVQGGWDLPAARAPCGCGCSRAAPAAGGCRRSAGRRGRRPGGTEGWAPGSLKGALAPGPSTSAAAGAGWPGGGPAPPLLLQPQVHTIN